MVTSIVSTVTSEGSVVPIAFQLVPLSVVSNTSERMFGVEPSEGW